MLHRLPLSVKPLLPIAVGILLPAVIKAQDLAGIGKGKPFSISGSIGAETTLTGQNGNSSIPALSSQGINANINLSIYGWSIPFSAAYYNRGFSYSRPFERYGLSPHYKWITLHAGWRNISWSPLAFGGVTFLGGGVELNPGKLRIGAVYGIFNKGYRQDTGQSRLSSFNYLQSPFRRKGYALKLGYGSGKSYIDFVFFHAKDDTTAASLQQSDIRIRPQENTALALNYRQAIGRHFTFTLNGALSLFTRDRTSDTIPESFYSGYDGVTRLQPILYSTQLSYAGDASLAYRGKLIDWKVSARRFSPFYQSLGIYSRLQDYQEERIDFGYHSRNNRFRSNLSVGEHHNNTAGIKVATTTIYTAQLSTGYEFSQSFGIDLGYNYNGLTQVKKNPFYEDTLLLGNDLHGINAGAHYLKMGSTYNDAVSFSAGYQTNLSSGLNFSSNRYNNFYALLSNTYSITASKLSINTSLSTFGSGGNYGNSFSIGGSAGIAKGLLDNHLSVSAGGGYFYNAYTGSNGSSITGNGGLALRSSKHHTFSLSGNFTRTQSFNRSYSIYRGQCSYQYTF